VGRIKAWRAVYQGEKELCSQQLTMYFLPKELIMLVFRETFEMSLGLKSETLKA
jgi:hypothetical protein